MVKGTQRPLTAFFAPAPPKAVSTSSPAASATPTAPAAESSSETARAGPAPPLPPLRAARSTWHEAGSWDAFARAQFGTSPDGQGRPAVGRTCWAIYVGDYGDGEEERYATCAGKVLARWGRDYHFQYACRDPGPPLWIGREWLFRSRSLAREVAQRLNAQLDRQARRGGTHRTPAAPLTTPNTGKKRGRKPKSSTPSGSSAADPQSLDDHCPFPPAATRHPDSPAERQAERLSSAEDDGTDDHFTSPRAASSRRMELELSPDNDACSSLDEEDTDAPASPDTKGVKREFSPDNDACPVAPSFDDEDTDAPPDAERVKRELSPDNDACTTAPSLGEEDTEAPDAKRVKREPSTDSSACHPPPPSDDVCAESPATIDAKRVRRESTGSPGSPPSLETSPVIQDNRVPIKLWYWPVQSPAPVLVGQPRIPVMSVEQFLAADVLGQLEEFDAVRPGCGNVLYAYRVDLNGGKRPITAAAAAQTSLAATDGFLLSAVPAGHALWATLSDNGDLLSPARLILPTAPN